jgi:hypothetical protein
MMDSNEFNPAGALKTVGGLSAYLKVFVLRTETWGGLSRYNSNGSNDDDSMDSLRVGDSLEVLGKMLKCECGKRNVRGRDGKKLDDRDIDEWVLFYEGLEFFSDRGARRKPLESRYS